MGAFIARKAAQAGKLGLVPSQLLSALLHRHVICLQHGSGCVETSAASLEALGKKGSAVWYWGWGREYHSGGPTLEQEPGGCGNSILGETQMHLDAAVSNLI